MTNQLEALISRAKHIIENGGLLARDTSLALIAALEQSNKLKETFRIQSNMFCADANELKARVEELESQRKMAFMASNRWSDKCRDAEKRIAELEASHEKLRECLAGIHNTIKRDGAYTPLAAILSATERAHEESATIASIKASQLAVKLPDRLQPGADGPDDWYLHSDPDGEYMKADDVIEAIRTAGITVQGDE